MRHKYIGGLLLSAWIGAWPLAAHADYLSSGRTALQKGDLRSAQIEFRNAVRSDPQNAEAHFLLGTVSLELGDPVAAEREAKAAQARGLDGKRTVPLLARSLMAQGRFKAVLEELKPNTNNPELDATILVFRGYAEAGLHNLDAAQKSFEQAASTTPNAVDPLLAEAHLAESRADLKAAQDKIDRAVALQPRSAEVLLAKSQLLRMKNDGAGALKVLDELITQQPSLLAARLERASLEIALNKLDAAKADIGMVQKAMPGNVQAVFLNAVIAAQSKDFKAADADLEKISPYIGRIPRAYYLLGVVKEQLGELAQAQEAASRFLARAPDDVNANKLVARIAFARGRPDQAIAALRRFADSGKADAEIYDILGRAYAATRRPADAVQAFQKAVELAPNNVALQTQLASARLNMGDPDTALTDLEHTMKLAPKSAAVGEALFSAALATGNMAKAQQALSQVRTAQGNTPQVMNLEGLLQLAELDIEGARQTFADIVEKNPDFMPARINLVRVTAMEGRGQESQKMLEAIVAQHPAAEPALTMLASNYVQTNHLAKAIALVEKAKAAEPKNLQLTAALGTLYIRQGSPQKALDLVSKENIAVASNPQIMAMQAAAHLALGQKDQAIAVYTELLKSDPALVNVRHQLVGLLVDTGNFEQARNVVQSGIAASPRNYQLYQDFVLIDLKDKGVTAALAAANRLKSQDQGFAQARALDGDVYLAANRPEDAVRAYQAALDADPTAFLALRLASAQIRQGDKDSAIKTLQAWVDKHPDDFAVQEQLSEVQISADQMDAAEKTLQTLLAKKPHDPVALNNLAWVYQQRKDGRALGLARQAYILAPTAQTADTLGWILTSSGKAATGLALLRQASAEANDPRILYHLAVALNDTGSKADAIKLLNDVVSAKGDFSEKIEAQKLLVQLKKGA